MFDPQNDVLDIQDLHGVPTFKMLIKKLTLGTLGMAPFDSHTFPILCESVFHVTTCMSSNSNSQLTKL